MKPVVLSSAADIDVRSAVDFYVSQSPTSAASFIEALERAVRHIASHPASGSPRYAHELNIPELRCWPLKRFPYSLFYIERTERVDVVRCVHDSRDIPESLREPL